MKAVRQAGYTLELASYFRSRNRTGSLGDQWAIERRALQERKRVLNRLAARPPDLWLTYHNYYKAPDLLGPWVSSALGIPYVMVEASHAWKREAGPWKRGQALTRVGIACSDLILQPNPGDREGVADALDRPVPQETLPPFLDLASIRRQQEGANQTRASLSQDLGLDPNQPWLVTTAMMRPGDKLASYRILGDALSKIQASRFALLVIGDGAARGAVEEALSGIQTVRYLGVQTNIACLHAACDLFVWPAVKEAFGFAALEAQAVGVPVILGDRPGTRAMVRDNETALLVPEGNAAKFADAVGELLQAPNRRKRMGLAAARHVQKNHGLDMAAALLRRRFEKLGVSL